MTYYFKTTIKELVWFREHQVWQPTDSVVDKGCSKRTRTEVRTPNFSLYKRKGLRKRRSVPVHYSKTITPYSTSDYPGTPFPKFRPRWGKGKNEELKYILRVTSWLVEHWSYVFNHDCNDSMSGWRSSVDEGLKNKTPFFCFCFEQDLWPSTLKTVDVDFR